LGSAKIELEMGQTNPSHNDEECEALTDLREGMLGGHREGGMENMWRQLGTKIN